MLSKPFEESSAGKQRGGVHVHGEQIADGVGIFAAIHAMQRRAAGVGIRGGGAIQRVFHCAGQGVQ